VHRARRSFASCFVDSVALTMNVLSSRASNEPAAGCVGRKTITFRLALRSGQEQSDFITNPCSAGVSAVAKLFSGVNLPQVAGEVVFALGTKDCASVKYTCSNAQIRLITSRLTWSLQTGQEVAVVEQVFCGAFTATVLVVEAAA